jgi:hypothetical protein
VAAAVAADVSRALTAAVERRGPERVADAALAGAAVPNTPAPAAAAAPAQRNRSRREAPVDSAEYEPEPPSGVASPIGPEALSDTVVPLVVGRISVAARWCRWLSRGTVSGHHSDTTL